MDELCEVIVESGTWQEVPPIEKSPMDAIRKYTSMSVGEVRHIVTWLALLGLIIFLWSR